MSANYTLMSGPELTAACGTHASKWAAAFRQHAKAVEGRGGDPLDEGYLIAWFANAMMTMHDHCRPDLAPVRLPDGSGVFVASV